MKKVEESKEKKSNDEAEAKRLDDEVEATSQETLPPPIEEMDEVLAFIYTGPCKPTTADFQ